MIMFVDYAIAEECKNEEAWNMCYKCGKCGRKFDDDGIMTDDGGTHDKEWSEYGETKQISAEFAKLMRDGEIRVWWR